MAEMTIRLHIDPHTGKKDIVVSLKSDADSLPHEHEEQHRALVEKLIQSGVMKAHEVGQVVVEREEAEKGVKSSPESVSEESRRSAAEGA